jgi:hypothetical protein
MTDTKNLSAEEEAVKLLGHMKTGLFSHLLILGTEDALENLYIQLVRRCQEEKISTSVIQFSNDDTSFCYQYEPADILLIKGLGFLPAKHNQAYSLRTLLDVGQYQGLRSFIFCEESQVRKHFNDYSAPFYRFCTPYQIKT